MADLFRTVEWIDVLCYLFMVDGGDAKKVIYTTFAKHELLN